MGSRSVRLTLALAVPVALLLSGCGGGGGGTPLAAVLAATAKTTKVDSARFRMTMTMTNLPGTGTLEIPAEGELDLQGNRTHLTMTFPEIPGQAEALGEMEVISDGTTLYMRSDALTEAAQAPTAWLKVDLSTLSPELADLQSLSSGQNDPSQALELLRGASELEEGGTEAIDGTDTTHYRGTLDLEKAAELAPAEVRKSVQTAVDQAKQQFGSTTVPMEVWVDSDELIRRMRFEYPIQAEAGGSESSELVLQMDLFDFGEPVEIEPPPADQVTDLNDLG